MADSKQVFNPTETTIFMKFVERDGNKFYIGNCDMDLNIKDCVLRFYPPEEDARPAIVINKTKVKASSEE